MKGEISIGLIMKVAIVLLVLGIFLSGPIKNTLSSAGEELGKANQSINESGSKAECLSNCRENFPSGTSGFAGCKASCG